MWVLSETWFRQDGTRGIQSRRVCLVTDTEENAKRLGEQYAKRLATGCSFLEPDPGNNGVCVIDPRTGNAFVMFTWERVPYLLENE
jgi:hypothetical protein